MNKLYLAGALGACAIALLLVACDKQKIADVIDSIKPDSLLLRNLQPGMTTVDDVRRQVGKPETVRRGEDGSLRYEYPRGPNGTTTYMFDFGPDGRLKAIEQVLTAENFARLRPGMTKDEVRRLLGKPTAIAVYALKPEEVWSWHWADGGYPGDAMFNAHFSAQGLLATTSRSDVPGHDKP